jgi:hypothetical protein
MIPFKPSSEKTLAHQLLTFVKLTSVLKEEQRKLLELKNTRPKPKGELLKWEQLSQALDHESQITQTEQRIGKLHLKTDEYEKELIQFVPKNLYNKTIEINLCDDEQNQRYCFLLKVVSSNEVVVRVKG